MFGYMCTSYKDGASVQDCLELFILSSEGPGEAKTRYMFAQLLLNFREIYPAQPVCGRICSGGP